jgi:hypothetical protein
VTAAVYLTIWLALLLFVAGDAGRARLGDRASARRWPWHAWAAGIVLCAVHFALAFDVFHDWSHDAAERATAAQTSAVFRIAWGGGVYVNYLFLAVWTLDLWYWRIRGAPPRPVWLALRCFYVVIILNAAVIFAAGWRRVPGAIIVAALIGLPSILAPPTSVKTRAAG